jgi:hypothetical protein
MNLRARVYVENQKKAAQANLQVRRTQLQEKGIRGEAMERDPVLKKIRAAIRQADYRLSSIAAQEQLNQERARAKAEKLAAEQAARAQASAEAQEGPPGKKAAKAKGAKKEKTEAPKEKKEKKTKEKKAEE